MQTQELSNLDAPPLDPSWIHDLEADFFTVPPVEREVVEVEEVHYTPRSSWPARLFIGACVGVVVVAGLTVVPFQGLFGAQAVHYPINEVITVHASEEVAPKRTVARIRGRARRTPSPKAYKAPPLRVDALPALSLATLKPGAAL